MKIRQDIVRQLKPIADDLDISLTKLSLAWCLLNPNVSTMILAMEKAAENDVQFLSITIDPARDTVETLKEYTDENAFDWPHLTSSNPDDLVQVWDDWNVVVDNDHVYANHSSHDHGSHDSHDDGNESTNETDDGHDGHSDHSNHSDDSGQNETVESGTDYNVGHSTVTFILDQDGNKKVAWSGWDWDSDLFLEDLVTMVYGSNQDNDDHSAHAHH